MKKIFVFLLILGLVFSETDAARARGGSDDVPYVVAEPTVTTARTPEIAHDCGCGKSVHPKRCVKACSYEVGAFRTFGTK